MGTEQEGRFREDSARFRLKVTRDEANDLVVVGKHGFLTPDEGENRVVYSPVDAGRLHDKRWFARRKKALVAGMILRQDGDGEGILGFDPARRDHWDLAIQTVGAKRKRVLSEEAKSILRERLARSR